MKIVLLAKFLRKDGASTHIYTLAKEFDKRGHEVHIISAGPTMDYNAIKLFNDNIVSNIKHHKVIFPCYAKFDFLSKVIQLLRYIFAIPQVLFILYKINPDIIHVHYPVTSYIARIYCNLTRKKFITTYHIKGIPNQILHRKADGAIAISSELKDELINVWSYNEDEIYTVFNGVDRERFDKSISVERRNELKEKFSLPKDKMIIGFVGTYEYKKGIDILIEVCSNLDKNKIHIVLVGDGDKGWVDSLIDKYNMRENITLQQFQDPVDLYSIFDIFVLPSRNEGFGLVAVEAMMMGVATIRSDVAGGKDMINHMKDGCLFENENKEELRKYLDLLINNKEIRDKFATEGKNKAITNFSEEVMITNMLKVYKDLISK